jgi:hypothetical protein
LKRLRASLLSSLLLCAPAHAESEAWATATLFSYHFDRRGYNEQNYGLGIEYHHDPVWRFSMGFYENSYYRTTAYAMAMWMPAESGSFRFGVATGIVTGYRHYPAIVAVPTISYEEDGAGFNIGITPAFVGVQVKFRFD